MIAANIRYRAARPHKSGRSRQARIQNRNPNQLLLVEKWTDREAQRVHMTQPHMAQVADIKARFAVDTKLEFYDC